MPGRLFLDHAGSDLAAALGLGPAKGADDPPRQNIAPGQQIIVQTEHGLEHMR